MLCPSFSYSQLCVCMTSCRAPVFPKIVILTSSSRLAALSLKFVAFDASTVKSFCAPRPLEKVSLLSCRATPAGAGGGAFSFSRCATHLRSEEHTSELQSRLHLVCRLLLEKKKKAICLLYNPVKQPDYTRS